MLILLGLVVLLGILLVRLRPGLLTRRDVTVRLLGVTLHGMRCLVWLGIRMLLGRGRLVVASVLRLARRRGLLCVWWWRRLLQLVAERLLRLLAVRLLRPLAMLLLVAVLLLAVLVVRWRGPGGLLRSRREGRRCAVNRRRLSPRPTRARVGVVLVVRVHCVWRDGGQGRAAACSRSESARQVQGGDVDGSARWVRVL